MWLLVLACVLPTLLAGQSRSELEARRKALEKKIRQTSKILEETRANKAAALEQVSTLRQQIRQREELIAILHQEIELIESRLARTTDVVNALQDDLDRLKDEYGRMLRLAWRQKLQYSDLLFLFSATSFNQLLLRWQYLKQYENYRQRQSELIASTRETLAQKMQLLEQRRRDKQALLRQAERQAQLLQYEMREHEALLANLESDEARLLRQLETQRRDREKLNHAIEAYIREEMTRREERLRREEDEKNTAETASGTAFEKLKGRLPWPAEGAVVRPFGRHPHPSLPQVVVENNGIDIRTTKGSAVRAVHDGVVVATSFVPANNYMVLVSHGSWFTVYANLEAVRVEKDQPVKAGQVLGQVAVNPANETSVLHFELWKGKQKQDPEQWLR